MSHGWTVEEVADRLLVSPSKVSRLETGQRGVSARDVRDLCDLYEVDDEQRTRLTELAAAGKERAWWQGRDPRYSTYVGLEAEATSIKDYGIGLVPGLLQTADYARAVIDRTAPQLPPEGRDERVQIRMARQDVLFADRPPQFQAVLDESVLRRIVGGQSVMHAQLQRLIELSEVPNVTIRVARFEAGALEVSKFIVLDLNPPLGAVVYLEGLTGDTYLERQEDIDAYTQAFEAMMELAASDAESRDTLAAMLGSFQP